MVDFQTPFPDMPLAARCCLKLSHGVISWCKTFRWPNEAKIILFERLAIGEEGISR
jgi:hypothetical protein